MTRAALLCAVLAAGPALAVEDTQWPPAGGDEARMRELQLVIGSRDSTLAQRDNAREELMGLLMSPGARARGPLPEKRPARAAVADPVKVDPVPVAPAAPPPGGVAHIEVVQPPKIVVNPNTGSALPPSANFAIDPRTGHVLHGNAAGYIDPRTGQFIPR